MTVTKVVWDRELTAREETNLDAKLAELIGSGVTNGRTTLNGRCKWETEAAANEWLDFVNTFDPAPVDARIAVGFDEVATPEELVIYEKFVADGGEII